MKILKPLFSKRGTIESPSVPLSAAFDILHSGRESLTGVNVTNEKALGLAGYWKGINLVSRGVAKTKIVVKRKRNGIKTEYPNHPAWFLLRKMPTGKYYPVPCTPFMFKQTLQANCLGTGNGYAYIFRDSNGVPEGLVWLNPDYVVPMKEDGKLLYLVTLDSGEQRRLNPMNVLHVKGLGFDGITGYSILDIMKNVLGLNLAYEMNQSVFFRNSMRPGWVIEVPYKFRDLDAVNKFRNKLGKVHKGLERSHIPMILEAGASAKPLTVSQSDAQFIESREFDLRMLANIFLLPSSKLNDVAKVAYNSLEQENQSVLDEVYDPWFVVWEEECEFKLLTEEEKESDSVEIEFDRSKIVRIPFQQRVEGNNKAVLAGWKLKDEARAEEGLNPLPDGSGQLPYIPTNVTTVDQEEKEGEEEDEMNIDDERINKVRDITIQTIKGISLKLFNRRISKAARQKASNPNSFMNWILDDLLANKQAYTDLLDPHVRLLKLIDGGSTDTNTESIIEDYLLSIRHELNQLAGNVSKTDLIIGVDRIMAKRSESIVDFTNELIQKG